MYGLPVFAVTANAVKAPINMHPSVPRLITPGALGDDLSLSGKQDRRAGADRADEDVFQRASGLSPSASAAA